MFESSKASYFGQYLWLYPFLKTFTTQQLTNRIMDRLGQAQGSKKMAFKFVLIGEKLIK
jgi:hypothetical protein